MIVPKGRVPIENMVDEIGRAIFTDRWIGAAWPAVKKQLESSAGRWVRDPLAAKQVALALAGEVAEAGQDTEPSGAVAREQWGHARLVLQRLLYGTPPEHGDAWKAEVITPIGNVYTIPSAVWWSAAASSALETGQIRFHPGQYGWIWSSTAAPLSGRVFVVIPTTIGQVAKTAPELPPEPAKQHHVTGRLPNDPNDETGLKIQGVLEAGLELLRDPHRPPKATQVARRLTNDLRQSFGGYAADVVVKIFSGSYRESRERGLPSLAEWAKQKLTEPVPEKSVVQKKTS